MSMTLDDDQWIDEFFMSENQSSGPFNSDKSDENKEPLDIESMSQNVEKEEETLVNKKQCQVGVASKSGNLNVKNDKGKDRNCRIFSHEKHARAERERRKKMRSMLDNLQDLIPRLTFKVDSVTIVVEAAKHKKYLQQTLEKLEKQKKEKLKSFNEVFTVDQRSFSLNSQMVKRATHQIQNAISVEESYKLAAGEIMDLLKF